ncbi:DNA-binding transcriptional regulator, AcrR family [Microlunatus flavus]|uniref:DNA-binding transcriptional regulator, AcrR family n=1 Tax=Microlunatus flavus TaxID=1036181 RepID=A0A1H9JJM1_9ACTN|nr:DNA-binding transcriptional regulator, AcrR family [Microlunatus flavus]
MHEAALVELATRPYDAISVETIARRAGVHRATLYRRWSTVEGVVAAALGEAAQDRIPVPDEGSLEADLVALAGALARTLSDPLGLGVMRVMVLGGRGPGPLYALGQQFWRGRVEGMSVIVRRAVDRSELPVRTDARVLLGALAAPICYQALVVGRDPDAGDALLAARATIVAAQAGLFAEHGPAASSEQRERELQNTPEPG